MPNVTDIEIALPTGSTVSGLLTHPAKGTLACYIMAHGAGAGMRHVFMASDAKGLAERGVACLRYQFPFAEKGSRRPDRPATAHLAVRATVDKAAALLPGHPLVAGGKSFGARMTSQARAEAPLPGVAALASFGFPLHPAGEPSLERATHLREVQVPMLFLQGTRDALAEMDLVGQALAPLGALATLHRVEGGDHGFHVPVRSGRTEAQVLSGILDAFAGWLNNVLDGATREREPSGS